MKNQIGVYCHVIKYHAFVVQLQELELLTLFYYCQQLLMKSDPPTMKNEGTNPLGSDNCRVVQLF